MTAVRSYQSSYFTFKYDAKTEGLNPTLYSQMVSHCSSPVTALLWILVCLFAVALRYSAAPVQAQALL